MKFHEALSSRRQDVPCGHKDGRTDGQTDRQTDMMKLMVIFCSFVKDLKID